MYPSRLLVFATLSAFLALGGCAASPEQRDEGEGDPLEGYNRAMHRFNEGVDRNVLKPVAEGYREHVPEPVRNRVSDFFSNINDVVVVFNDVLQGKGHQAAQDLSRLAFNTTFGVLGLWDVASGWDLPKHEEDFGQTLGVWGAEPGAYLVLPLLGPSSVRDGLGRLGDYQIDPLRQVDDNAARYTARAVQVVDTRAGLLHASRVLEQAAIDPYTFTRDAYLQRREHLVRDGRVLEEEAFDPFEMYETGQ